MFRRAVAIASEFTCPVVLSRKSIGGTCSSGIGSFVVLNPEGWIITANHVFVQLTVMMDEARRAREMEIQRAAIENDGALDHKEKRRRLRPLRLPDDATDRCSAWWTFPGAKLVKGFGQEAVDIAVGRLEPFDPKWVARYPVFKDPDRDFQPGVSLCKLGYPFHSITPTYEPATDQFTLPPEALPMPRFPMDGIFTRNLLLTPQDGVTLPYPLMFIETSSPGLRGQSGGPTFDAEGTVWGIQCQTAHLPLGFSPPVPGGKANEKEHQFLNVGLGAHAKTILGILKQIGVKVQVSTY